MAQSRNEFLSRSSPALDGDGKPIPNLIIKMPGWGEQRARLTFMLNVLSGNRKIVRENLRFEFKAGLGMRAPELDVALKDLEKHPQYFERAVMRMIEKTRELADLWIDSGKNPSNPKEDAPSDRNVEVRLPGHASSLFLEISSFLNRFPPTIGIRRDGTQGIERRGNPYFTADAVRVLGLVGALIAFGEDWGRFWFAALLDSPFSRRVARCDNCRTYFAYQRARLRAVKYGSYCPACFSKGNVKRTEHSREKRLDTAARAWIEWESRLRRIDRSDWIAEQVNKAHGTEFGRRWVSQHLPEIQKRVEALRGAPETIVRGET
jgi:hypothetical protein